MRKKVAAACISSLLALFTAATAGESIVMGHLETDMKNWLVEQMPGGSVSIRDGVLEIMDKDGCTVWFRQKLHVPVEISYEAMVVNEGRPGERTSDLNCFWMARDPRRPDDIFTPGHGRTGKFTTYDTLATYYVGYGGNNNTTTRLRRYTGDGKRPLLPEHDLSGGAFLLKPNHWYKIKLTAAGGVATCSHDGELLFTYHDDAFLDSGWFGIRTVASHLRIRGIQIKSSVAKP